jgi:hypothetical protein
VPWLGLWACFCEQSMGSSYVLRITATRYWFCTSCHLLVELLLV